MLETEAKQTPGIRRSVDIIKSRLGAGGGGQKGKASETFDKMMSSGGQHAASSSHGPGHPDLLPTSPQGNMESVQKYEAPPDPAGEEDSHLLRETMPMRGMDQDLIGEWMSGSIADAEMTEPGQWMEWGGFGLGGGFVPDTENLTFYDSFWGVDERPQ